MSCPVNSESNKKSDVRQLRVGADNAGQRLDNFLIRHLKGMPKAAIYRLIRTGQVRVNGGRCKPERKLDRGDEVRIPPVRTTDSGPVTVSEDVQRQVRQAILYEDEHYLVIDKPSGIAVHSGSNLPWGMIDAVRQDRPGEFVELVHRIDRETSGCVVLARSGQALKHLASQFREGRVGKKYLCLMEGRLKEARVTVDAPILKFRQGQDHHVGVDEEGKDARTRFTLLQSWADSTYAEVELFTGRTHQIRVHAAHLGLPLAGDERYSSAQSLKKWRARGLRRLFLHAHELSFESIAGGVVTVNAPLPENLRTVLDGLEA